MHSEAAAGRRGERSSLGVRLCGGEDAREDALETSGEEVPSDEPRGIFAAHARIPSGWLADQWPWGMA
jgi:hypothetical protein